MWCEDRERTIVKAVKAPEGDFRDWSDISGWRTRSLLNSLPVEPGPRVVDQRLPAAVAIGARA